MGGSLPLEIGTGDIPGCGGGNPMGSRLLAKRGEDGGALVMLAAIEGASTMAR